MSKHLLTVLLGISLALNAGILGGLFVMGVYRHYHDLHHYASAPSSPRYEGRDRSETWEPPNPTTRALMETFRNAKKDLMQELAKAPLNEAKVRGLIERSIAAQSALERDLGNNLLLKRKSLSAAEAETYFRQRLQRMEDRNDRFDRNNDQPRRNSQ